MSLAYLPIEFWFEVLSFFISLLVINRLRGSFLVYIVPMLAITIVCEYIGAYYRHAVVQNGWIYNIVTPVQVCFWVLLFREWLSGELTKKISLALLAAFFLFAIANVLLIQGWLMFNNYTLIIGSAMIIYHSCLYLYQFKNLAGDVVVLKEPRFYLASGPLFFFTGTFVYFAVYNNLGQLRSESTRQFFGLILKNLNIVYYGFISIGLSLINKKR